MLRIVTRAHSQLFEIRLDEAKRSPEPPSIRKRTSPKFPTSNLSKPGFCLFMQVLQHLALLLSASALNPPAVECQKTVDAVLETGDQVALFVQAKMAALTAVYGDLDKYFCPDAHCVISRAYINRGYNVLGVSKQLYKPMAAFLEAKLVTFLESGARGPPKDPKLIDPLAEPIKELIKKIEKV